MLRLTIGNSLRIIEATNLHVKTAAVMLKFKSHLTFLIVYLCAFASTSVLGQDKIYLRCEGAAKVGPSININIPKNELDKFVKIKPMTLIVTIADGIITVDNDYDFKNIPSVFSDPSNDHLSEYGGLEVKDTYYRGSYTRERYKKFKDDEKYPIERSLYSYTRRFIVLDRVDGSFSWNHTIYGFSSWINDLLPARVRDMYVNLEVEGKCVKESKKILF